MAITKKIDRNTFSVFTKNEAGQITTSEPPVKFTCLDSERVELVDGGEWGEIPNGSTCSTLDTSKNYIYSTTGKKWSKQDVGAILGGEVSWEDILGKPDEFTPSAHTHTEYSKTNHSHNIYALTTHNHQEYTKVYKSLVEIGEEFTETTPLKDVILAMEVGTMAMYTTTINGVYPSASGTVTIYKNADDKNFVFYVNSDCGIWVNGYHETGNPNCTWKKLDTYSKTTLALTAKEGFTINNNSTFYNYNYKEVTMNLDIKIPDIEANTRYVVANSPSNRKPLKSTALSAISSDLMGGAFACIDSATGDIIVITGTTVTGEDITISGSYYV